MKCPMPRCVRKEGFEAFDDVALHLINAHRWHIDCARDWLREQVEKEIPHES